MVLNFGVAPCSHAGGGEFGAGGRETERERDRDVDNKLCNLFTYSKQLNLVSGSWSTGTLVEDNLRLIIIGCNPDKKKNPTKT